MLLLLALISCIRNDSLPHVGDCAEYPNGAYTWGEIGIGTCLAGPTALAFAGDEASPTLLVVNANPYLTFTGGSVLAIPWDEVDLDEGRNVVSSLRASAVGLPHFPAGLSLTEDGLGLVPVRLSEDSRVRTDDDDLWLLDLSDPAEPALSTRGADDGAEVLVQADPVAVALDPSTGFAFVANRTSHSVSVVDLAAEPVEAIPPWPDQVLRLAPFFDADGSGSRAELAAVWVDDSEDLTDDVWSFSWVEGTWRLWVPAEGGLLRYVTAGQDYVASGLGVELLVEDYEGEIGEVSDPAFETVGDLTRIYFEDDGSIVAVDMGDYLGEWVLDDELAVALQGNGGAWDALVGGPEIVVDEGFDIWMFYDGTDEESWGIGAAVSSDGVSFDRISGPLLGTDCGDTACDPGFERIGDPVVIWDSAMYRWRMYFSAWDGGAWSVGHATSVDLLEWEADTTPIFAPDGVDAAAPVLSVQTGLIRMWYARRDGERWTVGAAESVDGTEWTDLGTVVELDLEPATGDEPPGPALYAQPADLFRLEGEQAGPLPAVATPGVDYTTSSYGWTARLLAGYHVSPLDVGAAGYGGVSVDSVDEAAGLVWLSLTSRDDDLSIGAGTLDADGGVLPLREPVLEAGEEGFDEDGVSSPVVVEIDGVYHMYYAGLEGEVATIGLATSDDGVTWDKQGQVLDVEEDAWDGAGLVPGSVEVQSDGTLRLWYTGTNGELLRVGTATSTDGVQWTREEVEENRPWAFPPGSPGDWDDSGVRDPWIVVTDEGQHLFYAGTDGDTWRVGHAFRESDDADWERAREPVTEDPRPVLGLSAGLFHPDGVRRPVATYDGQTWSLFFAGLDETVSRVGRATGKDPEQLYEIVARPTLGDTLQFSTQKGDEDTLAIPLDTMVEGTFVSGEGLIGLALDTERGFLFAATTHTNYLFVIDVRDDSDEGARDDNYLDIEAILLYESSAGGAGFRSMLVDGDRLYGLVDSPESVVVFDLDQVLDDAAADVLPDTVLGVIPATLALETDRGVDNVSNVGPGGLVLHPDGRRLFVTNYNDNSMSVIDLTLGPWGTVVDEVEDLGENPYAIALSPDGALAVVANYTGEVSPNEETSSTLAVIDVNEDSETYLEVLTWVVNR